jgi:hypothetical protein
LAHKMERVRTKVLTCCIACNQVADEVSALLVLFNLGEEGSQKLFIRQLNEAL